MAWLSCNTKKSAAYLSPPGYDFNRPYVYKLPEILDEISAKEGPDHDYRDDLASLEELWLEKLEPYGEKGYNEKKISREERLRMITRNQQKE